MDKRSSTRRLLRHETIYKCGREGADSQGRFFEEVLETRLQAAYDGLIQGGRRGALQTIPQYMVKFLSIQ